MLHHPPLGQWAGNDGGFDFVLNKIRGRRVGNLTFGLIKFPPNHFSDTRDRRRIDHLTFPNGRAFEFLVGQIPTLVGKSPPFPTHCFRKGGTTIDRCIMTCYCGY